MKSHWLIHNGKRIFYADYSSYGVDAAALKAEAEAIVHTLVQEPVDSVLSLSDVRGTLGSPENFAIMKGVVARTKRHVRKRVIVGVEGTRRALLEIINRLLGDRQFTCFDDVKTAQDWLTQDK